LSATSTLLTPAILAAASARHDVLACDQHVDIATDLGSSGNGVQGGRATLFRVQR
jgi:hypothetical protein